MTHAQPISMETTPRPMADPVRGTHQSGMRAYNERLVLSLIRQRHTVLPETEFVALVRTAERQARLVGGVLRDLVHGLPPGTLAMLDELSETQPTRQAL